MQIRVAGRHVEVPNALKEHVEEKAGKLSRFYDGIHEVEVVFDYESEQYAVEMIVRADRKRTFVASESGPDSFVLVDVVVEKLERQLTKHKEKNRNHKHEGLKGDHSADSS